jgi:amylosucrase
MSGIYRKDSLHSVMEKFINNFSNNKNHVEFINRLLQNTEQLTSAYNDLYFEKYSDSPPAINEYENLFKELLEIMLKAFNSRRDSLRKRDKNQTPWYLSNHIAGAVLYVDLFSENITRLLTKIEYIEDLGINYLHLMPLYNCPENEHDGGYAVSDYRTVRKDLGTMADLVCLADELHKRGIYLVLDFILNHVSNQHSWAKKALKGQIRYQHYFYIIDKKSELEEYQTSLRDIFPEVRKGSFTWNDKLGSWIWTTFHSYQWDLNYSNPAVLNAMARELLAIANIGADVLRFDALAFIWKEKRTCSENLPQAHTVIRAFKTICKIVAPSVVFKSEAIVHPAEVKRYISRNECELSYNPLLMALSWEALATRETKLLRHSLAAHFKLNEHCNWVNYVRSHDDIGWTFDDTDAARTGIQAGNHRSFLNKFYTGEYRGSFARGLPFQENLQTNDLRISGTCASLAGLEKAIEDKNDFEINLAVKRVLLLYSVAFSIGGIPLVYFGDELGSLNDYTFKDNPALQNDTRWAHRLNMNWDFADKLKNNVYDSNSPAAQIYNGIKRITVLRKSIMAFSGSKTEFPENISPHLLIYRRFCADQHILVLNNFCEHEVKLDLSLVCGSDKRVSWYDLYSSQTVSAQNSGQAIITMSAYQVMWLEDYGI